MIDQKSNGFAVDLQVRDYECDMEGIVNNAVYLNYLEHARHEFLKTVGIDFAELTRRGIKPVVLRSEVDYKASLRSGNRFRIGVSVERVSKLRIAFVQDICRLSDSEIVARARIIAAVISASGRPILPEEMSPRFAELLHEAS